MAKHLPTHLKTTDHNICLVVTTTTTIKQQVITSTWWLQHLPQRRQQMAITSAKASQVAQNNKCVHKIAGHINTVTPTSVGND